MKSIPLTLLLFYFKSIKNNNNNKYGHFHLSMCVYDGHKNWHNIWFQFLFLLSISYHIIYSIYACLWYLYLVNFFSLLYQIDDDDEKFQEFFWLRETKKTDMKIPLKRVKKKIAHHGGDGGGGFRNFFFVNTIKIFIIINRIFQRMPKKKWNKTTDDDDNDD